MPEVQIHLTERVLQSIQEAAPFDEFMFFGVCDEIDDLEPDDDIAGLEQFLD